MLKIISAITLACAISLSACAAEPEQTASPVRRTPAEAAQIARFERDTPRERFVWSKTNPDVSLDLKTGCIFHETYNYGRTAILDANGHPDCSYKPDAKSPEY